MRSKGAMLAVAFALAPWASRDKHIFWNSTAFRIQPPSSAPCGAPRESSRNRRSVGHKEKPWALGSKTGDGTVPHSVYQSSAFCTVASKIDKL